MLKFEIDDDDFEECFGNEDELKEQLTNWVNYNGGYDPQVIIVKL